MGRNGPWAAALGVVAVVWGGYTFRQARLSADWPADRNAPASRRERRLDLRYRYSVAGQTYQGDLVSYSSDSPLAMLWPAVADEKLTAKYPRGAPVTVYYDPADPARAVLETGGGSQSILILLGGLVAIAYGVWEVRGAG